jgi:hypothetical protein
MYISVDRSLHNFFLQQITSVTSCATAIEVSIGKTSFCWKCYFDSTFLNSRFKQISNYFLVSIFANFYQFVCGARQSFESRFFKSKKIFQYSGKLKWKVVTCKQTCLLHNKLLMLQLIIILKVWWMGITYV